MILFFDKIFFLKIEVHDYASGIEQKNKGGLCLDNACIL